MTIESVSQVNGTFDRMNSEKRDRAILTEIVNKRKEQLIQYCRTNGPILVYKDDKASMLEAKKRTVKKLDKATLASEVGVSSAELTPVRIARLVEQGKLTAQQITKHMYEEEEYKLSTRRAKKAEVVAFNSQK